MEPTHNQGGHGSSHTKRYAKNVPGHHTQMDVKFITLKDCIDKTVRRFQYTAIYDWTRIRAKTLEMFSKKVRSLCRFVCLCEKSLS